MSSHHTALTTKSVTRSIHAGFRIKPITQAVILALLLNSNASLAGPSGGNIVGGSGSISQSDLNTTINQNSSSLAINWNSFNVNANERVQFIQPNASAIALNRILGSNASQINGRIDANGQIVLVNPQGVFFGQNASINVGGLIASGLAIDPVDFMNGNYVFNAIDGTAGQVVNSGTLNASLGGSVSLIGQQVSNEGLIAAHLGAVNLAAGKQAVLSFDANGLMGVRVSKEILQSELGVDPAVLNSGEINAAGGRVLLTGSVSQDIFSQAVNTGALQHATSVVVHDDGTFTLGAGANVVNSGVLDVSTVNINHDAGQVVLLGENVTSSGVIKADAAQANGGDIELHATNTTLLTDNSLTSAQSNGNGTGGIVKVLGKQVGLFDQSTVDVSGTHGGGSALLGGDYQGKNARIRNASLTYVSKNSNIYADALAQGDAGQIINWADSATWFYGNAYARGGAVSGNGGLIEVSGKQYLEFRGGADTSAIHGAMGQLLLDPTDILIRAGTGDGAADGNTTFNGNTGSSDVGTVFSYETSPSTIYESELEGLSASTNIVIQAINNITIQDLSPGGVGDGVLLLQMNGYTNGDGGTVTFTADADSDGGGGFIMNDITNTIKTQGGQVNISGASVAAGNIETFASNQTSGYVNVTASGAINIASINTSGADSTDANGRNGGNVVVTSTDSNITIGSINTSGGDAISTVGTYNGGSAGTILITSGEAWATGTEDRIYLNGDLNAVGGTAAVTGTNGTSRAITLDTPLLITTGVREILGGTVTLQNESSGTIYVSRLNLGASLAVTADANNNIYFFTDVNYNGINATNHTLALNAGNSIDMFEVMDSASSTPDALNINLAANQNNDAISLIRLRSDINTGGGTFSATGLNFDSSSNSSNTDIDINSGTGQSNIDMTGYVLLGGMTVGGTLDVTAGTSIKQGTTYAANDILDVTGTSTFSSTGTLDTDDIILTNTNLLRGAINLATNNATVPSTTAYQSDISLTNAHTTTTINNINVSGELIVNAAQSLTVTGAINGYSHSGSDNRVNTLALNFGTNGTGATFTATGATIASANSAGDGDVVNVTINGGAGSDTFDIDNAQFNQTNLTTYSRTYDLTINGNDGVDTFNIATDIAGSNSGKVDGGAGNDVFNIDATTNISILDLDGGANTDDLYGANRLNNWELTANNLGTLNGLSGISFSSIENLYGNDAVDNFVLTSGTLSGSIRGGLGNDSLTGRDTNTTWTITDTNTGTLSAGLNGSFTGIETLIGNNSVDTFLINGGTLSGSIDGRGNNDVIEVGSNTTGDKSWVINNANQGSMTDLNSASINPTYGFANIESLNGGTGSDTFTLGLAGSLSGSLDGGAGSGVDTLTGKNLDSIWTITAQGVGSITDLSNVKYITGDFADIENLTGGTANDTFRINDTGVASGSLINQITGSNVSNSTDTNIIQVTNDNNNNWVIDGVYSGSIADVTGSIVSGFQSVQQLIGHTGVDTFTFTANNTGTGEVINSITGGNNANNAIVAANTNDNTWLISNSNQGNISDTSGMIINSFTEIQNLTGGASADTFILGPAGRLTGSIAGGDGAALDTLVGKDEVNTWVISGINSGVIRDGFSVNYITNGFSSIESLTGGTDTDSFNFTYTNALQYGSITGLINGGDDVGIVDTIDLFSTANFSGDFSPSSPFTTTIQLGFAPLTTNANNVHFGAADIELITANNTVNVVNTLFGNNTNNNWFLRGTNSGSIGGVAYQGTPIQGYVIFNYFANLTGGNQSDSFVFGNGSSLVGVIDGGLGADSVDLTTFNSVTVQLGTVATANQDINNVETITARNVNGNEIIGANTSNTWNIDGDQTGTVNGTTRFVNFDTLTGGVLDDAFIIPSMVLRSRLIINGGTAVDPNVTASFDTLSGPDFNSTWRISAASTTLRSDGNEVDILFSGIENLTGGTGNDLFQFQDILVDGLVNGGAGAGLDTIDYSMFTSAVDLQLVTSLPATVASSANALYANGFETIAGNGNNTITSRIVGENANNNWFVNGSNSGYVTNLGTGSTLNFSGINELVGNAGVDTFEFLVGGSLSGNIIGGNNIDSLTAYASSASNNWTITGANAGTLNTNTLFSGIETLNGSTGTDTFTLSTPTFAGTINGGTGTNTLTAYAALVTDTNTWNITGTNSGTLNTDTVFTGMSMLRGGTGVDNFTINAAGFIGTIDGRGGNDSLTGYAATVNDINSWNITAANTGSLNTVTLFTGIESLYGSIGSDQYVLNTASFNGYLGGGASGTDTLQGFASANSWAISAANTGTLNTTTSFGGMDVLTGNIGQDDFILNVASFNGQLDGGTGGSDSVTGFAASSSAINTWDITAANTGTLNTTTAFTNIDVLNGGIGVDNFTLGVAIFPGTLNGGSGIDTLTGFATLSSDVNNWAIFGPNLGILNSTTLFTGMDNLIGNIGVDNYVLSTPSFSGVIDGAAGSNFLTGYAATATDINSWNITATDRGTLNTVTDFRNIATLTGGAGIDNFVLANGSLSGSILGGGGTADSLQGDNINNAWLMTSAGAGTVNGIEGGFSGIESLIGGTAIDTLTAMNSSNAWIINSTNGGTLNASLSFASIENLVGGTLDDAFNVNAGGNVGGLIDGNTGADILNFNTGNDVIVSLGGALVTANAGLSALDEYSVNNFERVNASGTQSNTLIGADVNQLWIISGINAGAVGPASLLDTGIPISDVEGITKFTNFDNVQGGALDDSFRFEDNSDITTSLSGGNHVNGDTIDLSLKTDVLVRISDGLTGYAEIEGYRGNNTNSTLIAGNTSNLWTITSNNDGTVVNRTVDPDTSFTFENFNILIGGNLDDDFVVNAGGSVIDLISGNSASGIYAGDGDDTLTVNLDGLDTGGIAMFDGGADSNSILFRDYVGGTTGFDLARYTPDATNTAIPSVVYDFINYDTSGSVANAYAIQYINSTQVQDNVTVNELQINGTSNNDVISLGALSYSVSASTIPETLFTAVDYSNKANVSVISGLGVDTVILESDINLGASGDLALNVEVIDNQGLYRITANNLILDNVSSVDPLAVGQSLLTNVNVLNVVNSTSASDALLIEEASDITLAGIGSAGSFQLTANGSITHSNALISTGIVTLQSGTGNIELGNMPNTLSGLLTLQAPAGNVILTNQGATNIDLITAGNNLTINSTGAISDGTTGVVTVGNLATLTAGTMLSPGDILLNNSSNSFNGLTVNTANNLDIYSTAGLTLGGINAENRLSFAANDSIVINAGITSANGNVLIDSGQSIIMSAAGSISALQANANVTLNASNDVTLRDVSANEITVLATNGQIVDGNGAAMNLVANSVNLTANTGINGLQTTASNYNVANQSGVVNLSNNGTLNITRLHNNGDITLLNDATITIYPGGINANRDVGDLFVNVTNGSMLGGGSLDLANADITAHNGTLFAFQGSIGLFGRPLVIDVPGDLLIQARSSIRPFFSPAAPTNFVDDSLQQFSSFDTVSALSGQQLVEVESLAEIDPAIFTDVNIYSHGDISIRMPIDQLYEDDDSNKEEGFERVLQ